MAALTAAIQRPLLGTRLEPLAYAAVPLLWVLQETARSHTPFGGFPWARLAFSQADSPLAHLAAYAGAPGVTFAVAALGAALHAVVVLVLRVRTRAGGAASAVGAGHRRRPAHGLGVALVALAVLPAVASLVVRPPTGGRTVDVMFVQGNVPRPGLDFNAERRQVLDNHVQQTLGSRPAAATEPGRVARERLGHRPAAQPRRRSAIRSAVEGPVRRFSSGPSCASPLR